MNIHHGVGASLPVDRPGYKQETLVYLNDEKYLFIN
jgi:hypothetical protein